MTFELNTPAGPRTEDASKVLHSQDKVEALEIAAASLEGDLQKLRADRCIERYFWVFCVSALLNVLFYAFAPWVAATIFLIFTLVGLLGLGKWLEVPFIAPYLERWFEKMMGRLPHPGETE